MAAKLNKEKVKNVASELVAEMGCRLIEVEIKKSGDKITLGLIIDKNGGVNIDDCENVSKKVDPVLDETEGVAGLYDYFTVSSAGLDRPFKTTEDFATHIGEKIEAKLYSAVDKKKLITDILIDANDEFIIVGKDTKILRNNIQKANIAIEF